MPIILLIIGIFIIVLSSRGIKKENSSFSKLLIEKEEVSNELDIEIAEIRRTFGETIADLQIEIMALKEEVELLKNKNVNIKNKDEFDINRDVISSIDFDKFKKNAKNIKVEEKKVDKIRKYIEDGLTDNEICSILSVGKGEVLLVRNLLRK